MGKLLETPKELAERVGIPVSNVRYLIREDMLDHIFTAPGKRNPKIPVGLGRNMSPCSPSPPEKRPSVAVQKGEGLMGADQVEQSEILDKGRTPAQWVEVMAGMGIVISERTLRGRANDTGAFFRVGRTMLITPAQIDTIFEEGQACRSKSTSVVPSTGSKAGSITMADRSPVHTAKARERLLKLARGTG
ncbi:hypothetical protein [Rhodobacter maris]|uniref:Uncharacterized protein n=1 Tax=Rhodobacter maris TaxID=446682 RepID=A0A285T6N3_9RHOB|nr:hypothetical protein [Rhodobacter maris]SOC15170.1 hypothetical protein SAMN05877831_11334 [Rhodobacter maris]